MQELKQQLRQAKQNFDYADENYIDVAIAELNVAEEKLNIFMKEARGSEFRGSNKPIKRSTSAL